jgi:murein DD-endopeptidase MepM/ murein hydrolase activator NlpD
MQLRSCQNGGRGSRGAGVVTHSRRSALALMVLGLFVFWALIFDPTAGAKLPPATAPGRQPSGLPIAARESAEASTTTSQILRVHAGDTLMGLLQQVGVSAAPAQAAIEALRPNWDPRGLQIGQEIAIGLDEDGLKELRLSPDFQSDLILKRGDDGHFDAATVPRDLTRVPARVAGTVTSSLFEAASDAGMPPSVLAELTQAFSYDVDFQREIQPGDGFEILYDQMVDTASGKSVGAGDLVYAAMNLSGHRLQLYRYTPPGGAPAFYTGAGASVKKALLRTPVDGARVSSSFGMRHHPILGYTAMHKGVDFAVPTGTPIMASGDGTVAMAGRDGGYGNIVVLRHAGGYSTAYAHMSRFAPGIKPGVHVAQGQVIGYVGATGLATGPHLHYEVRFDDRAVNPLSVHMQASRKLRGQDLAAFRKQEATVAQRLADLRSDTVAAR